MWCCTRQWDCPSHPEKAGRSANVDAMFTGDTETRRVGERETGGQGDGETRRFGDDNCIFFAGFAALRDIYSRLSQYRAFAVDTDRR